jgi:hypothetical protein
LFAAFFFAKEGGKREEKRKDPQLSFKKESLQRKLVALPRERGRTANFS